MSKFHAFGTTLVVISCVMSLIALIITYTILSGWIKFFKEYSNLIKKQLYTILLSFIFYPIIVLLYCGIGSIDLIISFSTIYSTILWTLVLSSFFIFRIIRLLQTENKKAKINKHKKYMKECLLLLLILNFL
eukprot:44659_1